MCSEEIFMPYINLKIFETLNFMLYINLKILETLNFMHARLVYNSTMINSVTAN